MKLNSKVKLSFQILVIIFYIMLTMENCKSLLRQKKTNWSDFPCSLCLTRLWCEASLWLRPRWGPRLWTPVQRGDHLCNIPQRWQIWWIKRILWIIAKRLFRNDRRSCAFKFCLLPLNKYYEQKIKVADFGFMSQIFYMHFFKVKKHKSGFQKLI